MIKKWLNWSSSVVRLGSHLISKGLFSSVILLLHVSCDDLLSASFVLCIDGEEAGMCTFNQRDVFLVSRSSALIEHTGTEFEPANPGLDICGSSVSKACDMRDMKIKVLKVAQ